MPMTILQNRIWAALLCPKCDEEYMLPPVTQCRNGHAICNTCKKRFHNTCPECNNPMTRIVPQLRALTHLLDYPCKFHGCPHTNKGNLIQSHELTCRAFVVRCAFQFSCGWHGKIERMVEHLKERHGDNGNVQRMHASTWSKLLIRQFGFRKEVFYIIAERGDADDDDKDNGGAITLAVLQLTREESFQMFTFGLFPCNDSQQLMGLCQNVTDEDARMRGKAVVHVNGEFVREHTSKRDGEFQCNAHINRIETYEEERTFSNNNYIRNLKP